jgi:hypothetical protein
MTPSGCAATRRWAGWSVTGQSPGLPPLPARWAASRGSGSVGRRTSLLSPICPRPVDRQGAPAAAARTIVLDMDSSEARPTASRKAAPTTAVSAAPAVLTGSVHTSCGSTHMSMLSLTKSKPWFLLGLFLLCVCTLVRQIIETRIFSESHGIMSYFLRSASRCSE